MHFCIVCRNMYSIHIDEADSNKLTYFCNNCHNTETIYTNLNVNINNINIKNTNEDFNFNINEYTKFDPTLPRINNILCPNPDCETNKNNANREIIYICVDNTNLKYIYLCSTCDTKWKAKSDST